MRKLFLLCVLTAYCAPPAFAQSASPGEYPGVEFFAGYSAIGEVNTEARRGNNPDFGNVSGPRGFETSVAKNVNRYFGVKGDFSAHFDDGRGRGLFTSCVQDSCTSTARDFNIRKRFFNFLAGPEVKARNHTRLTPFAHALFGVAHANTKIRTDDSVFDLSRSDTGFAMAFGGGLDVRLTRRVSVRSSIDYNPTFLKDSGLGPRDRQDNVRLSLGVLIH